MKYLDANRKPFSGNEKLILQKLIWDDARTFLALARKGTLTAASKSMDMGIATLSRRIERLEKTLATPLFVRQQSGYQLTEDGKNLVEKAEQMEAAIFAFVSGANADTALIGKVRLATAENLATHLILPAMSNFQAQYPQLTVEILTNISTSNLHRHDADLALRMVRPTQGHVTFKRVGTLGYGLYASKHFLAQHNFTQQHKVTEQDFFIGWSDTEKQLPAAQWLQQKLKGREPILTTTSVATQISACSLGLGFAVLPHLVAQETGLLCIETDMQIDQEIYIVIQADLAHSPRIRAMADFLTELVIENKDRLRGK